MKLKSNNWFWYVFGIACICVCVSPWAFTRPYHWKYFDFTQSGDVGDTIGGITAPIIGLFSIFFLIMTLREQIKINEKQIDFNNDQKKFNKAQEEFNEEQLKFNYATRILSLETYITQAASMISFNFYTSIGIARGKGLEDTVLLKNTRAVDIDEGEFNNLFDSVVYLDISLSHLYDLVFDEKNKLDDEQKFLVLKYLKSYFQKVSDFYSMVNNQIIKKYQYNVPDIAGLLKESQSKLTKIQDLIEKYKQQITFS